MDNFTKRSKKVLEVFAQFEGKRLKSDSIGPEHIFLGLLKDDDSVAARILKVLDLRFDLLRKEIEYSIRRSGSAITLGNVPINMKFNRIVELARAEANKTMSNYIGTEHLLLALFKDGSCAGIDNLIKIGVDYEIIKSEIMKLSGNADTQGAKTAIKSKTQTVDEFSRNLTVLAQKNKLDPVVGRDNEIDRVVRI
jgi:ATP-dependent Clp protease ATP-binding subunit ClpC